MKIQIGETEYPIRDLTIEQYMVLNQIKELDDLDFVALMTGAPKDILKKVKVQDLLFASKYLKNDIAFQDEIGELDLVIEVNGVRYGLIKPSEMTFDEFVNLEIFMAEKPLDLPKIAVHLYRPVKDDYIGENRNLIEYDLQECLSRMDEFKKHFPIKKLMSALFFLITFGKTLTDNLLEFMETTKTEEKTQNTTTELPKK
jgi:hypothetical protein